MPCCRAAGVHTAVAVVVFGGVVGAFPISGGAYHRGLLDAQVVLGEFFGHIEGLLWAAFSQFSTTPSLPAATTTEPTGSTTRPLDFGVLAGEVGDHLPKSAAREASRLSDASKKRSALMAWLKKRP